MTANLLMLGAFATSVAFAIVCILVLRLVRRRQERRSPLQQRQVGHVPGQQLVERVADSQESMLLGFVMMYLSAPLMLLAWALQRVPAERLRYDAGAFVFLLGALAVFGFGLWQFHRNLKVRHAASDGLLAERVTGMQLNRLVAQNCLVLHDLPCEGFNIDHVVVAPRAVYAVETKSMRKPKGTGNKDDALHRVAYDGVGLRFPDFQTRAPIEQANQQAQWLRRYLRDRLHAEIPVIPAVALPGWFVERSEAGRQADVVVFTPMGKGADFMAWAPERIRPEQRQLIAQALALRYPEIKD